MRSLRRKDLWLLTLALVPLFLVPLGASGENFDGTKPCLCATTKVVECLPEGECTAISITDVNMPRFFITDFENNRLLHKGPGASERASQIERQEKVDGKWMLQGAEDGAEGVRDGVGWTLAIDEDSGDFVLSASGEGAAFVVFGACTSMP